jgi:hypothetical protein
MPGRNGIVFKSRAAHDRKARLGGAISLSLAFQLVLSMNLEHSTTAAGLEQFGVAKSQNARAAARATGMPILLLQERQVQ